MLHEFESWSASRSELHSFNGFKGTIIAIEADFYLGRLLSNPPSKEPLLSALGGLPFALTATIENELDQLKDAGITLVFIFNGLEVGKKYRPFQASEQAARLNAEAWELYQRHEAERAVETFGNSGSVHPQHLYTLLQSILRARKISFQVAPYGAIAQLAYLENFPEYVDIVASSSEILLFDVEKAIVKLDFDRSEITWIKRRSCIEEYGNTPEKFRDACILAGSTILPPLPQLETSSSSRRTYRIRGALDLMNRAGQTGISVCMIHQNDPLVKNTSYIDRYKKSWMAIKHHVVLKFDGKVEPLDLANAPSDMYQFMGQRLPDELYFYLSRGVCGPRVLNWLTQQEIIETPPLDGGNSEDYRSLVQDQLTPLRTLALSLLSRALTRAYQHRSIGLRCWFDQSKVTTISLTEFEPSKVVINTWHVRETSLNELPGYRNECYSLKLALHGLSDDSFAAKTITSKQAPSFLETISELEYNTLWRFLHYRGYVSDDHKLTSWGKVLSAIYAKVDTSSISEDAPLLAVELLRMDLLTSKSMFPSYSGAPIRGSETDKANTLLVSRIACLVKLRHKQIGFTGPLSRHLLAYTCLTAALRRSLRDLLEMTLVTLFLAGDAQRVREDYHGLGLSLPLLHDADCGLGVAMKSYLDEVNGQAGGIGQVTDESKEAVKEKGGREWFLHAMDFRGDLERAFELWDAIVDGIKVANELKLMMDEGAWEEVDAWVKERR